MSVEEKSRGEWDKEGQTGEVIRLGIPENSVQYRSSLSIYIGLGNVESHLGIVLIQYG